jgi:hypothetical protein
VSRHIYRTPTLGRIVLYNNKFKFYKDNFISSIHAAAQNHNSKYVILLCSYVTLILLNLKYPSEDPKI